MECNGKNCYHSEHEAKSVRKAVGKKRSVRLRVYKCPECHYYHLTSTEKCEAL